MYNHFLKNIFDLRLQDGPHLLALSGGVDSMLLYALLKRACDINLHIVHVDHKWSENSGVIAQKLQEMVLKNGDTFHIHKINHILMSDPNVEDLCRRERLEFFSSIYKKISAKALFLAHHADDQVEVVLKRIFEGSYITNCKGMQKKECNFSMQIYRPLLDFKKSEIISYSTKNQILFFEDPSNQNTRFLRARFREKLLKEIKTSFGKPIEKSVLHISVELNEVQEFLEKDFENSIFRLTKNNSFVSYQIEGLSRAQIRFAIKKICKSLNEVINREQMRILLESIAKNRSKNQAILARHRVVLNKKMLNFLLINA